MCEWYWGWMTFWAKLITSGPAIVSDYLEMLDCIRKDHELEFQRYVTENLFGGR